MSTELLFLRAARKKKKLFSLKQTSADSEITKKQFFQNLQRFSIECREAKTKPITS